MNDLKNAIDIIIAKLENISNCMKPIECIEKDVINKMYQLIQQKYMYIYLNINTLSELLAEANAMESDILLLMNRNNSVESTKNTIKSLKQFFQQQYTNGNTAEYKLECLKEYTDKLYYDFIARGRLSSSYCDLNKCAIEEVEKDVKKLNKTSR